MEAGLQVAFFVLFGRAVRVHVAKREDRITGCGGSILCIPVSRLSADGRQPDRLRSQGHSEGVQRLRNLVLDREGGGWGGVVKHEIPRPSGLGMTEREEGPLDEAQRQALSKLDPENQRLARKYPCAQGSVFECTFMSSRVGFPKARINRISCDPVSSLSSTSMPSAATGEVVFTPPPYHIASSDPAEMVR